MTRAIIRTATLPAPALAVALLSLLSLPGCDRDDGRNASTQQAARVVVLYTPVDEPVARPIALEFTKRTGITVVLRTDSEATKTAGIVQTLRAEKDNPRADVFWNNEVFHTINLAADGVLAPYDSPAAKDIPAQFKDPAHRWAASGLRIRTIALAPGVTDIVKVEDLANPKYKGRVCMGFPALGTIAGQVSSWFVAWGPARAEKFLDDLRKNDVKLLGGNSEVVKQIALGNMLAGLTDNDDVDTMLAEGGKLSGIPARTADGGALAMPISVALVAGAKHPDAARQLIDYLLSPEVEQRLISAKFAARSVRGPGGDDVMKVDYREVARMMPQAVEVARRVLEGRK